ncbi:MAG: hypothetical protein JRJ29_01685 [Deltaproteobacteria bacterium]|nr:hypothetical protein [Deltaproteobacteria bacterium]
MSIFFRQRSLAKAKKWERKIGYRGEMAPGCGNHLLPGRVFMDGRAEVRGINWKKPMPFILGSWGRSLGYEKLRFH